MPDRAAADLRASIATFRTESIAALTAAEAAILAMERGEDSAIATSFRALHTVKGSAHLLGFTAIADTAHAAETVIELIGEEALRPSRPVVSALLAACDAVRHGLDDEAAVDPTVPHVIARLEAIARDASPASADRLGDILVSEGIVERLAVELAAAEQTLGDARQLGEILVGNGDTDAARISTALLRQRGERGPETAVRVEISVLDALLEMATELDAAGRHLCALAQADPAPGALCAEAERVHALATRVRDQVRITRMQPIGNVWGRLPRVVRDAAFGLGKEVRLQLDDRDLLVDTAILERVVGPVVQLVRNAVDHGIEPPDTRVACGKPRVGTIRLGAERTARGYVVVVADDGRGIDVDQVRAIAIERGVVTAAVCATLDDDTAARLVFAEGLSTATELSQFSGRGIGMDVVRTSVVAAGGEVTISTDPGVGTSVTLEFPCVGPIPHPPRPMGHGEPAAGDASTTREARG